MPDIAGLVNAGGEDDFPSFRFAPAGTSTTSVTALPWRQKREKLIPSGTILGPSGKGRPLFSINGDNFLDMIDNNYYNQ